jgi:hypothetical protein
MPMRTRLDLKSATRQIQTLWKEIVGLAEGRYIPKFGLTDWKLKPLPIIVATTGGPLLANSLEGVRSVGAVKWS